MKVKATVARVDGADFPALSGALDRLAKAFNNMRDELCSKVLEPHIVGADEMGPGELFVQESDRMGLTESGLGCDIQISRMSKSPKRSEKSFWDALDAFKALCVEKIEEHLPRTESMQLFISFVIDGPIWNRVPGSPDTNLIEGEPIWVEGKA